MRINVATFGERLYVKPGPAPASGGREWSARCRVRGRRPSSCRCTARGSIRSAPLGNPLSKNRICPDRNWACSNRPPTISERQPMLWIRKPLISCLLCSLLEISKWWIRYLIRFLRTVLRAFPNAYAKNRTFRSSSDRRFRFDVIFCRRDITFRSYIWRAVPYLSSLIRRDSCSTRWLISSIRLFISGCYWPFRM